MIRYCSACDLYTLKSKCPKCNSETEDAHPPKSKLSISLS